MTAGCHQAPNFCLTQVMAGIASFSLTLQWHIILNSTVSYFQPTEIEMQNVFGCENRFHPSSWKTVQWILPQMACGFKFAIRLLDLNTIQRPDSTVTTLHLYALYPGYIPNTSKGSMIKIKEKREPR